MTLRNPGSEKREFASENVKYDASEVVSGEIGSLSEALVRAIYGDSLSDFTKKTDISGELDDESRLLLEKAKRAVDCIEADISDQTRLIRDRFSDAGVESEVHKAPSGQIRSIELKIERRKLPKALKVLDGAGYPLAGQLSAGAVAAIKATTTRLELLKDDESDMRLVLNWRSGWLAKSLPRRLRPAMVDYSLFSFPAFLWPAYVTLRPFRARFRAWMERRLKARSGFVLSQISLGTPDSLIAPLFDLVGLTADDRLMEFGCGDGRVVFAAAKKIGCSVLGIESNSVLAEIARDRLEASGNTSKASIENRLASPEEAREADVVFLFQPMSIAAILVPEILKHLPAGGRILMHEQSDLHPDLTPDISVPVISEDDLTVAHIWRK